MCSALELVCRKAREYARATGEAPKTEHLIAWLDECQDQGNCTDPPKPYASYTKAWQEKLRFAAHEAAVQASPKLLEERRQRRERNEKIDSLYRTIADAMTELTKLGVTEGEKLWGLGRAMFRLEEGT